ncbi:MAG: penicillin-binding protein 2, partial [Candidatus Cloacimonetes bacterium]|nr:penicillin-binding protein 2 [Candidatus Cloacimonadota bacterium]
MRLKVFAGLNIIFIIVWIVYLFIIQVNNHYNFEPRLTPQKEIIYPKRGNIYDSNKKLLVGSKRFFQVDFDTTKLQSKIPQITKIISKHTNLSESYVNAQLTNEKNKYIYENIPELQIIRIQNDLKKINAEKGLVITFKKIERIYPFDKLGSCYLGGVEKQDADSFANAENGNKSNKETPLYQLNGICGLESGFNEVLKGKYGWQEIIGGNRNNTKLQFEFFKKKEVTNGNSLVLTIDNNLQEILENNLAAGLIEHEAKNAIGIIMEPETGKILAMHGISKKNLDASAKVLRTSANPAVASMFEPGSTFKPFTALLAIENNIYEPTDIIDCTDYPNIYQSGEKRTIRDDDDHKKPERTFKNVIVHSSNPGISRVADKVGTEKLYDLILNLGFGHKIGDNLNGESAGILTELSNWSGFALHSISFGQAISVTALQLANAYCALANDGKVMRPYIVDEIIDEHSEIVTKIQPKILRNISNKKSLNTLKTFLKSVVEDGTAQKTKIKFLDVAGKTGTAEKADKGGYSKDKYTSLFAGFFPVENPQYAMVVVYDEANYENKKYYASLSAVPTFKDIIIDIANLPQSNLGNSKKVEKNTFVTAPDLVNLP